MADAEPALRPPPASAAPAPQLGPLAVPAPEPAVVAPDPMSKKRYIFAPVTNIL